MKILNAGSLALLDSMGTDDSIVSAARICYGTKGNSLADQKLLTMLVREEHMSPMEHTSLTFEVSAPIFVARQWMRHRVGCSYNEKSLRYCEAEPEFYVPEGLNEEQEEIYECNQSCWEDYRQLLHSGVPREQARAVLPLGIYTTFAFTCNMASLFHFLKLRLSPAAQMEIRVYAKGMLQLAKGVFPITAGEIEKKLGGITI